MTTSGAVMLPRKVLLFSGHMIDAPGRKEMRFPADKEPTAADAIARTLDEIDVGSDDLAICSAACGGDLLFAEASLVRGVKLQLYIPFEERKFLHESVDFADADWRRRFFTAKEHASLRLMPDELGPLPLGTNPYERNNLWMMESAMKFGAEKVEFICLWDGLGGDGPGGTRHLMKEVHNRAGRIHWLNTKELWN